MPRGITGEESPDEIIRMVLEDFQGTTASKLETAAEIVYQDATPILKFQARVKNDWGECICYYRLDRMLLTVFPECERIYDEAEADGLLGEREAVGRNKIVRHLAGYAIHIMLTRLMMRQLNMFEDNFNDTCFMTASALYHAMADASPEDDKMKEVASGRAKKLLDATIATSAENRRAVLLKLLNLTLPLLTIPTGVGRPKGRTKSAEQKAQEAAEFEKKVEEAIRTLLSAKGKMPTKTAVAKALHIGGLTKEGTDTSLPSFSRKIKNLKIDYPAIVERVKLNK